MLAETMRRAAAWPVLAALAAAQSPPAPAATAPVERDGPHLRLVCHLADAELADQALAAAEAAWPHALRALGLPEQQARPRPTIHLHADVGGYERAEAALTGGAFRRNLAFSHFGTRTAHVALQPVCSAAALREFGLPTLTRYIVAHEASHLCAYSFLPGALNHPDWFAEGMATSCGLRALADLGLLGDHDAEPLPARMRVLAQQQLERAALPPPGDVLLGRATDAPFYERYAAWHAVYEFLRETEPRALQQFTRVLRRGGGRAPREAIAAAVAATWNEAERGRLRAPFAAYVGAWQPRWFEQLRALERRGDGWVQRAFPDKNAIAWRRDAPIERLPAAATGTLRIVPGAATQLNFLFGRGERGFFSVAFTAGTGVTLFRCDFGEPDATWTRLGAGSCDALTVGAAVPFEVTIEAAAVAVAVGSETVLRAGLDAGRDPRGQWGLGAQAGACGEWRDLRVAAR